MTVLRHLAVLLAAARDRDLTEPLRHYREHGWARLGRVLDDDGIAALCARADDIMLGRVSYPGLFFQIDTATGRYEDLTFGKGWEGPSLSYRKIEKLERDPLFRAWLENALFERVARALVVGDVVIYRAVLFSKAARREERGSGAPDPSTAGPGAPDPSAGGTLLPWHQDAGRFWGLDRDPELQIWTALDDAGPDAGCVEVLSGSHHGGLATPLGGLVPPELVAARQADRAKLALPAHAGEALLIHNQLWHRSGVNDTARPRRAFTVSYMSAATRCLRTKRAPRVFVRVFGDSGKLPLR